MINKAQKINFQKPESNIYNGPKIPKYYKFSVSPTELFSLSAHRACTQKHKIHTHTQFLHFSDLLFFNPTTPLTHPPQNNPHPLPPSGFYQFLSFSLIFFSQVPTFNFKNLENLKSLELKILILKSGS